MEVIEGSRQPAGNLRNCMVLRSWFLYRVCVIGIYIITCNHAHLSVEERMHQRRILGYLDSTVHSRD